MIRALVLNGEGINCERETAFACELAGFKADIRSVSELISTGFHQEKLEKEYGLVVFPGGFSYGDELGSGRVLALKIRKGLKWDLIRYAEAGGLVLGICNGFQALIRLGIFGNKLTITRNAQNKFLDRWVELRVGVEIQSVFLNSILKMNLPIRHGEGRVLKTEVQNEVKTALAYSEDVNGSDEKIAGLMTSSGRVLGLMPHPEAFVRMTQFPLWTSMNESDQELSGEGLQIFKNAFAALEKEMKYGH